MKSERIVIAGCGYIGSALAERLVAEGHSVWGLRRTASTLPDGVMPLALDLADEAPFALPDDIDVIVYAASADEFTEDAYRAAYVTGVKNLIEGLARDGQSPRLMLFTSSTGVYHQTGGTWVVEESPAWSTFFSGRLLREGEELVKHTPYPSTTVRFGGIYGPQRTRLLNSIKDGTASITSRSSFTNRIHRDDCAGILHHLITISHEKPLDEVYLGVDCDPAEHFEVVSWLADRLGVAPPAPASHALDRESPNLAEERAHQRPGSNKRCANKRIVESGYTFLYPSYRQGYDAIIEASE